jgi:outer membrane protein insertion porin family
LLQLGTTTRLGIPYSETGRVFLGLGVEKLSLNTTLNTPLQYQKHAAQLSGFDPNLVDVDIQ